MNLIAKLPSWNVLLTEASSKKRVFEQVGLLYENHHHIARSHVFSLFAREKPAHRPGPGHRHPHGRIKGLKEAVGAFVRLKQAIPFDAPDGQPVSLIFVLLVPDRATDLHLQILSELAQMFSDKPFRERLLASATPAEVNQLVAEWQPHAASQHSPVV
jgi:PTS system nitrogen regulatory IIA component